MGHNMRKCTFWYVRPTKYQISLRICTVRSESSLSTCRNFASMAIQNVHGEDFAHKTKGYILWGCAQIFFHKKKQQEISFYCLTVTSAFNSFHAKFQMPFVIYFFILTNLCLERPLYVKLTDWMSNSIDLDETAHWAVSSGSMLFAKAYYYHLWQWKI